MATQDPGSGLSALELSILADSSLDTQSRAALLAAAEVGRSADDAARAVWRDALAAGAWWGEAPSAAQAQLELDAIRVVRRRLAPLSDILVELAARESWLRVGARAGESWLHVKSSLRTRTSGGAR